MGLLVGLRVGEDVGSAVGSCVGEMVGAGVGAGVSHVLSAKQEPLRQSLPARHPLPAVQGMQLGPPQSTSVSLPPFTLLRHEVGVGANVGALVGVCVGVLVGLRVGLALGR